MGVPSILGHPHFRKPPFKCIYPLVNWHSYGKSPFYMGKSSLNRNFNSYVSLPEGKWSLSAAMLKYQWLNCCLTTPAERLGWRPERQSASRSTRKATSTMPSTAKMEVLNIKNPFRSVIVFGHYSTNQRGTFLTIVEPIEVLWLAILE